MMQHYRKILCLSYLIFVAVGLRAQLDTKTKDLQISILTCAPGADIASIYGHNALRIKDTSGQADIVYNWGTYNFKEPGFIIKFVRGKLNYWLAAEDYPSFLAQYEYYQRGVTEQILSLDSIQKLEILNLLETNFLPQNRTYKYDFFMDNCATRITQIVDRSIGGISWDEKKASQKTFRQIIKEFQVNLPWTDFGIDLIIGANADRKTTFAEETFIPQYLSKAFEKVGNAKVKPISPPPSDVLTYPKVVPDPLNVFWNPYLFFGLLLLAEVWIWFKYRNSNTPKWLARYDSAWIWLMVFLFVVMFIMWFFTDHIPTKNNWNILWASPLWFVWWFKKSDSTKSYHKVLKIILSGLMMLAILNAIYQFLPQYFHPCVAILCGIMLLKLHRNK
jgi:hypothetical protein